MTTRTLTHLPHTSLTNIEAYILKVSVRELPTCPPGFIIFFFKRRLLMDDHPDTHPLASYLTNQYKSLYPEGICQRDAHLPTRFDKFFFRRRLLMDDHSDTHPLASYFTNQY